MKNYEILYLYDGENYTKLLLELNERTKPVMCKTTYAFEVFQSDKEFDEIKDSDEELRKSDLLILGEAYSVKEFAEKFPDERFSVFAMWEPNNYTIVWTQGFKCSWNVAIAIPKTRPFVCTTSKKLEWQVSSWGYELITKTFKFRII